MGPLSQTWSFTNRLTGQVSPRTTSTIAIGSQPSSLDRKAVEWRVGRCPPQAARCPSHSTDLATAYKYPSPHYTLKIVGVELDGEVPHSFPSFSQLSSLALAIEQQSSSGEEQERSFLEFGRVFWVWYSSFVILSFLHYFIQYLFQYFILVLLALL